MASTEVVVMKTTKEICEFCEEPFKPVRHMTDFGHSVVVDWLCGCCAENGVNA